MKTIQQYWARLVAAGLAPDCNDAWARDIGDDMWMLYYKLKDFSIYHTVRCQAKTDFSIKSAEVQLRKDGIDLVKLEWQKPTAEDVGKMCWVYDEKNESIILEKLERVHKGFYFGVDCWAYKCCLLATCGRLAPTIKDFEEVYE